MNQSLKNFENIQKKLHRNMFENFKRNFWKKLPEIVKKNMKLF